MSWNWNLTSNMTHAMCIVYFVILWFLLPSSTLIFVYTEFITLHIVTLATGLNWQRRSFLLVGNVLRKHWSLNDLPKNTSKALVWTISNLSRTWKSFVRTKQGHCDFGLFTTRNGGNAFGLIGSFHCGEGVLINWTGASAFIEETWQNQLGVWRSSDVNADIISRLAKGRHYIMPVLVVQYNHLTWLLWGRIGIDNFAIETFFFTKKVSVDWTLSLPICIRICYMSRCTSCRSRHHGVKDQRAVTVYGQCLPSE